MNCASAPSILSGYSNKKPVESTAPSKSLNLVYQIWRRAQLKPLLEFCINEKTLVDMAHLSLKQRVAFVNNKFQTDLLTVGVLQKWFRQEKVRRKKIVTTKDKTFRPDHLLQKDLKTFKDTRCCLLRAIDQGRRVVFLDESVFSSLTIAKTAYSKKRTNIHLR